MSNINISSNSSSDINNIQNHLVFKNLRLFTNVGGSVVWKVGPGVCSSVGFPSDSFGFSSPISDSSLIGVVTTGGGIDSSSSFFPFSFSFSLVSTLLGVSSILLIFPLLFGGLSGPLFVSVVEGFSVDFVPLSCKIV